MDYTEPCAGNGALIQHLNEFGHLCVNAYDIEPQNTGILKRDALDLDASDFTGSDYIITNPPWQRRAKDKSGKYLPYDQQPLPAMIEKFRNIKPTWLLFDSDWMHTKASAPYMKYCHKIVSVGRIKWIADSKNTGVDNCQWHLFDKTEAIRTEFVGR